MDGRRWSTLTHLLLCSQTKKEKKRKEETNLCTPGSPPPPPELDGEVRTVRDSTKKTRDKERKNDKKISCTAEARPPSLIIQTVTGCWCWGCEQ